MVAIVELQTQTEGLSSQNICMIQTVLLEIWPLYSLHQILCSTQSQANQVSTSIHILDGKGTHAVNLFIDPWKTLWVSFTCHG